MSLALFAAEHLLTIPFLGLAAYMAGRRVLGRLAFGSLAEEVAVSAGMGVGLLGTVFFLLGLAGAIRPWSLLAVLGGALASGGRRWRAMGGRGGAVAAALLAAASLPAAILALYPPTAFDSTLYHLPIA